MNVNPIEICAYNPAWSSEFAAIADVLQRTLGGLIRCIEHVGSTSVPNLDAKPIIDIDVVIESAEKLPSIVKRLETVGYIHEGNLGIEGREAFKRAGDDVPRSNIREYWMEHHLYVCVDGARELTRHIAFRDYLRQHPEAVKEYSELKWQLAKQYRNDRNGYTGAKSEFVNAILRRCMPVSIKTLHTPRLILRPIRLSDAPRVQMLFPHMEILKYMTTAIPWPYPENGAAERIQTWLPKIEACEEYVWAITLNEPDELTDRDSLIGVISLNPHGEAHRGFWIGVDYQGKGYMSEASDAVNDFAFFEVGMEELIIPTAEPNIASQRIKERVNATVIEIKEDVPFIGGRFREYIWRITKNDWVAYRCRF